MKLYLYIFIFWIAIGIIIAIKFPNAATVIRMPTKLGSINEIKISNYEFPIAFSVYMSLATLSFLALLYTFGVLKIPDKK